MTIYRNGVAEPNPDPALVELLREHRWNPLTEGCSCGWSQREGLGRRIAQHNHHIHQAAKITSEVVRVSLQFAEQLIDEPTEQELKRLQAIEQRAQRVAAPSAWALSARPNDHSDDDRSLALWILGMKAVRR